MYTTDPIIKFLIKMTKNKKYKIIKINTEAILIISQTILQNNYISTGEDVIHRQYT